MCQCSLCMHNDSNVDSWNIKITKYGHLIGWHLEHYLAVWRVPLNTKRPFSLGAEQETVVDVQSYCIVKFLSFFVVVVAKKPRCKLGGSGRLNRLISAVSNMWLTVVDEKKSAVLGSSRLYHFAGSFLHFVFGVWFAIWSFWHCKHF